MVTLNENVVAFTVSPGATTREAPIVTGDAPAGIAMLVTMEARTVVGTRNRLPSRAAKAAGWWAAPSELVPVPDVIPPPAHDPIAVVEAAWAQALTQRRHRLEPWSRTGEPESSAESRAGRSCLTTFRLGGARVNSRSVNIGAETDAAVGRRTDRSAVQLEQHVRHYWHDRRDSPGRWQRTFGQ